MWLKIKSRNISISEDELRSKMSLAEKQKNIHKNEFGTISSERPGLIENDVKDFTPQSVETKYMIDPDHKVQEKILNFEKGIDSIEASL